MPDRLSFLRTTQLLAVVPDAVLGDIDRQLQELTLEAGDTLFHEGEVGDAVYLIMDGKLRLESNGMQLMTRTRGDCVGEFALVDNEPRSAAAVAETKSRLLRWQRQDFLGLQNPDITKGIFKTLTSKLREDVKTAARLELERQQWRQDLARAREIQQGMLPSGQWLSDDFELAGVCSQASQVGGDFYDYMSPSADSVALMIADVTRHGFYAGLFVAMIKSCLHTQMQLSFDPPKVMSAMRSALDLSIQRRLLMSCCYVLFEPGARRLRYANAGHPYPYLWRQSDASLQRLEALDPILGAEEAGVPYSEQTMQWEPGDLLVLYTDGVTEARDDRGTMFGFQSLEACITETGPAGTDFVKDRILAAISTHAGEDLEDDLTLVVVKAR